MGLPWASGGGVVTIRRHGDGRWRQRRSPV